MVDHMIGTWEGKKGKKFQIRNKVKEGRSFGNAPKRKEGRSLGNGWSTNWDETNKTPTWLYFFL